MWHNQRGLSGDDDKAAARDDVWGLTSSLPSPSHGAIGARAVWNRMEPAEEEREEEALPSYLSYLQLAFRPAAVPAEAHAPSPRNTQGATILAPAREPMASPTAVSRVPHHSAELAEALEHLVVGTVQRHLRDGLATTRQVQCRCTCDTMREQMQEMARQIRALQNQVLELSRHAIPTAIEVSRVPSTGTWSAYAPPFVPKHCPTVPPLPPPVVPVEPATTTVLSDRISTLEGRQSAFQSQLAQMTKVLGIPSGKPGKHSPVKHLVQTLRDEVEAKVQQATTDLMAKVQQATTHLTAKVQQATTELTATVNAVLGDKTLSEEIAAPNPVDDVVLAALAREHEASLARLSGSVHELLADETRQRIALETRVNVQLSHQEEWLQQLEGTFGSPHTRIHEHKVQSIDTQAVSVQVAALEQKSEECRELWQHLAHVFPDVASSRLLQRRSGDEGDDKCS